MLPREAVEEFKKIYRERFGKEISDKGALEKAYRLFGLYKAIYVKSSNSKKLG